MFEGFFGHLRQWLDLFASLRKSSTVLNDVCAEHCYKISSRVRKEASEKIRENSIGGAECIPW